MSNWIAKKTKEIKDGSRLKKFFDDKEKLTQQFKALHGYGSGVSSEERKKFHQTNYRRAFSVCRNALDEYAKRGAQSKKSQNDDIKRPCEIMEALTRLCQDIPHLVKQNWNHNALSELFTKFLNFNTNQEIRLQCITFIFVVINAAKASSHKKYVQCLKYSADYTPFCIQVPYENYYNNFKKNLIVAQEPLPWIRTGPTNKAHCIDILSQLLSLIKDANDFDFWYLYMNKHIYSQLYHSCTCNNGPLIVSELYKDESKNDSFDFVNIKNMEKEGFGSVGPPPSIQALISEWVCQLLSNNTKNKIILSKKSYILYVLEIFKNTMKLPPQKYTMAIYNVLKRIEMWILGIDLTIAFKNEIQKYYQIIITYLFELFGIEMSQLTSQKLHKKLNLVSYAIYLLRLISGEGYIALSPLSWQCLIKGMIAQIKYFKANVSKKLTLSKQKQSQQIIEEKIVHPLIHCLFKSFVLMSISDNGSANVLLTQFKFEMTDLITYAPFVIQWREIIRNITIELLNIISAKVEETEKNYAFHNTNTNTNNSKKKGKLPSQNLDMNNDNYKFSIEQRLKILKIDIFEFNGLDEAFMIYDRLLHLLGAPNKNDNDKTRLTHLEGFTDALKIFISALGIKAKKKKYTQSEEKKSSDTSHNKGIAYLSNSVYGFPHSLICVPIDVSQVSLTGHLPQSIRANLPLPPREQLPQSDTLIEIFGPWLFDLCLDILLKCSLPMQVSRLNEFRMSFECLSLIFLTYCEITFDDLYLAQYYRIIKYTLVTPKMSTKLRSIVVHECSKGCIFGKNLSGVNCLIPDFCDAMIKIVGYTHKKGGTISKDNNKVFMEQETSDILQICMSLICFGTHFSDIRIQSFGENKSQKSLQSFAGIKQIICDVFCYITNFNGLPINIVQTVIWGLVLLIFDEVSSSKSQKLIKCAISAIVCSTNIGKLDTAQTATRAIESLSPICKQICEISEEIIISDLFEPFLVNALEFVYGAGDRDIKKRNLICKICTHQIYCALEWMFRFPPNVLCNDTLMQIYFKVLHQTLCLATKAGKSNKNSVLSDLVLSAQTSKLMLFHYLGNFPLTHDSSAISSNASDDYKGSQEGNVFLSYDSNVLITANDRILAHCAGPEPGVRLLLRDESGKFAWNFTPCSIQPKPTLSGNTQLILPTHKRSNSKEETKENKQLKPPKLDKRRPPNTSPPPKELQTEQMFNDKLSSLKEKHANVTSKPEFVFKKDGTNDGLAQVLTYVKELTPPLKGKKDTQNKKVILINIKDTKGNVGSFPSGHLSDKSRAKLAKYMDEQKREEHALYGKYRKLRTEKMSKLKKLQTELAKGEERKEDGVTVIQNALNDMKIREAVTGFDCSRFLLGHFGILTPGHVLGVKDSLFSDVTSDDIAANALKKKTKPMSPPTKGSKSKHITRNSSMSQPSMTPKRNSGKQYRLDPYLYSLDQNLLAMFGNKDNAFHRRLRLLDQSSFEREKHKIGVVYVGPDHDTEKVILAIESGSIAYARFIRHLGWTADLLAHQGFNGAMNACTTGRFAKYYNTASYEMAFHIATNMPTNHNNPRQIEKKKHIGNDQVNIIWTDHGREYIVDTIITQFNQVQIVVYPLNNGMFRIKIHKKVDVGYFGPLLNNMVIREHLLPILVRITSLYANRTVRYAASVYTRPFVERKRYLDEATDKNSHKSHESILGAFFPYMAASASLNSTKH